MSEPTKRRASGKGKAIPDSERHTRKLQLRVHPELEERVRALSDTYDLTLAQVVETALDSLLASGREERAYVATLGLPEARDEYETVVGLPPSAGALEVATRLRMAARSAIAEDRARLAKRRP
jgi:hypothetical protein